MGEQREYPFEFTVVMAVYNVEPYLRAAVTSLINQDFGFEKIQLIMVDDGSTDGSGAICDEYAEQYPDNVIVIHKENGGASSARNAGAKIATGKYLNFMDPDDRMDRKVFSSVYTFFSEHRGETDIVAIPFKMFGLTSGPHPANAKFNKGTRVIDLEEEWWYFQMSLASAFLISDTAKKYCFHEDLQMASAEDAREVLKVLIHNPKLGVISDVFYRYRRRPNSQVSTNGQSPLNYTANLRDYCLWAMQYASDELGYVPKHVQFALLYHIQWKLREAELPADMFTDEEADEYRAVLNDVLSRMDHEVIAGKKTIYTEQKSYALMQKTGKFPEKIWFSGDIFYSYENVAYFRMGDFPVILEFAELTRDTFMIEGWVTYYTYLDQQAPQLFLKVNGEAIEGNPIVRPEQGKLAGTCIMERRGFRFSVPLNDAKHMLFRFYCRTQYGDVRMRRISYRKYFPIGDTLKSSYYWKDGWKLTGSKNQFYIQACGRLKRFLSEISLLKELWKKNGTGQRKAVFARLTCHILRPFKRKQIWLICDKADRADDNGEAFFKYMQNLKPRNINIYFLIGKESKDYERLSKIGKVVPYMSWKHKQLYLMADYVISAYSHPEINNPFLSYHTSYKDLMQHCKFVFLQHGITKDDVSKSLNRAQKNIKGFVTAAKVEHRSIIETPAYLYDEGAVWLTGFPRYDYLYHQEEKAIVVMPTWRQNLFSTYSAKNSRWTLKEGFYESDYYQFYNGLLNHDRLLKRAQELEYQINFVPHPIFFPYVDKFAVPAQVKVWGTDVVYRDMFAKNKLLVTDFSSVAFDFAYLRKPVIYTHFDQNHYAEGYFDYERDGFGEVEYDLESTVDRIIEYMENDCKLKEQYRQRIDGFFTFNDQNNCQRVYKKILELDKLE